MRLINAGCLRWPLPLSENQRDWRVLSSLSEQWDHLDVLVKSADRRYRIWQQGRIAAHYLPNVRAGVLGSLSYLVFAVVVAIRIHRRTPIAIFNASDPISGAAGWFFRVIAGVPFVFHIQGEILEPPRAYGGRLRRLSLKLLTRFLSRRADRVRALYVAQARSLVALGVRPGRISVLQSRCDTRLFDPERWADERESLRVSLDLTGCVGLMYVGGLLKGKGIHVLVGALPRIVRASPNVRLIVVGSGPYRDALAKMVDDLGLGTAVSFAGVIAYKRVPSYLAAADIFVFPSLTEASPRAVLEAMSMRLPIVASLVGGIPEMVVEGETGALVPPGDEERLASAVIELVGSPESRIRMGRQARALVQQKFEFEQNLCEYQQILRLTALRKTFWSGQTGTGRPVGGV